MKKEIEIFGHLSVTEMDPSSEKVKDMGWLRISTGITEHRFRI